VLPVDSDAAVRLTDRDVEHPSILEQVFETVKRGNRPRITRSSAAPGFALLAGVVNRVWTSQDGGAVEAVVRPVLTYAPKK
jgi:hypothetical protein